MAPPAPAADTPGARTRALTASLERRRKLRAVYGANPADSRVARYELRGLEAGDARAIRAALAPAAPEAMAEALTRLRMLTRSRASEDARLLAAAYMERLSAWPGDAVLFVLDRAADRHVFFPAWAELKAELEFWAGDRIRLGEALARAERREAGR